MTNPEFSNTFDLLFNNISSNRAAGLNEYEKSVFLTKAEGMLVKEYFNQRTDGVGGGFDGSEKRQYDFSSLIKTQRLNVYTKDYQKLDNRSHVYLFPRDYFLSVNEIVSDDKFQYTVLPLTYQEYRQMMMKPYNYPVKRAVWRILTGEGDQEYTDSNNEKKVAKVPVAEIIGGYDYNSSEYVMRYVRTLKPIILTDLSEMGMEISINGETKETPCELPEETHQEIVERAVFLAQAAWGGTTATAVEQQQQQQQRNR